MWSPHFVPRPKDWPDYVDIVGTIFSDSPVFPPSSLCLPSLCPPTHTSSSSSSSSMPSTTLPTPLPNTSTSTSSSTPRPTSYAPSSQLLEFLSYTSTSSPSLSSTKDRSKSPSYDDKSTDNDGNNDNNGDNDTDGDDDNKVRADLPIFIGFGSMVIENPKGLLQLLLQGMLLPFTIIVTIIVTIT